VLIRATPSSAGIGASVELAGERLCGEHADCVAVAAKVELGIDPPMVQARILAYADTMATIEIPVIAPPGDTDILVTVDGRTSNPLAFVVLVP
jgi:hypothetical protein